MTVIDRRTFARGLSLSALASSLPTIVSAQSLSYPSQDVRFICGFAAGSGADIIVRFMAERLRPIFGRTIIVENKPGALGNIATEYTARSKPDGHTIQVAGASSLAANMHLVKNPPLDVTKEVQIAATLSVASMMIAVRPDAPWKDIPELTAAMKAKGAKASYGFATPIAKVIGALYKEKAGLEAVEVAYRTGADYINDLASSNIDYVVADNIQAMGQAQAGRMRLLAVGSSQRLKAAAHLPTLAEFGYPIDIRTWWGAMVPAETPKPIVNQINAWFVQALETDEARAFFRSVASDVWISTPAEAQAYLVQQVAEWRDYVRIAKIEPQ